MEANDENLGLGDQDSSYELIAKQALAYAHDLKKALHQSRTAQTALDRLRHTFLGVVNHEMRTPLVLIFQVLEILEDTRLGPLTKDQMNLLMVLRRQADILDNMVDGLTRIASFLSKQETINPAPDRLEPVLDTVIPLAEFKARSKEITVEADIAPDLPVFPFDAKQLTEALTQLLDNAIKFNRRGGKVRVSARADGTWIIVAVADTGIGIQPEQMATIWEVFEQAADPLRRTQEGLGLGLALTHFIVDAHGGLVEADTTPGRGSTFTVRLPVAEAT